MSQNVRPAVVDSAIGYSQTLSGADINPALARVAKRFFFCSFSQQPVATKQMLKVTFSQLEIRAAHKLCAKYEVPNYVPNIKIHYHYSPVGCIHFCQNKLEPCRSSAAANSPCANEGQLNELNIGDFFHHSSVTFLTVIKKIVHRSHGCSSWDSVFCVLFTAGGNMFVFFIQNFFFLQIY